MLNFAAPHVRPVCMNRIREAAVGLLCGFAGVAMAQAPLAARAVLHTEPDAHVLGVATVQGAEAPAAPAPGSMESIFGQKRTPKPENTFPVTPVGGEASSYFNFGFNFSSSTTITGSAVLTLGATGQDFQDFGGSCDDNGYPYTYAAGTSCNLYVGFSPTRAGNRLGAAVLNTSNSAQYYYGVVNGIGNAPQLTFAAATPSVSTLASGLAPYGSALDGAGNLWVSNTSAGTVNEFTPTAGVYPTSPSRTFSGFTSPQGIAFDGIGNVYIGDGAKGYVWRLNAVNGIVPSGAAPSAYANFLVGGSQPVSVAFDPTGSYLYIIGQYSSSKYLIYCTLTNGSCGLVESFAAPQGIAIDAAGYKYVVDSSQKLVYRIDPAYNATPLTTVVSGLQQPYGIASDAAGDLYVSDGGNGASGGGTVTEYLATNGLVSTSSGTRLIASGLYAPAGVTLDSSGDVFIADTANNAVKLAGLATAPFVLFPNTALGSVSSSQFVTVQNVGNVSLSIAVPSSGQNPSAVGQYKLAAGSTCPVVTSSASAAGSIAEGATCTYAAAYAPSLANSSSGYLLLNDNNLGQSSTQQIHLSGSTMASPDISVAYTIVSRGATAANITFIVGYGSNPVPANTPTLKVNGSTVSGVSCTSKAGHLNCSATYNPSGLAPGSYPIVATEPGDTHYSTTSGSGTLTVTK